MPRTVAVLQSNYLPWKGYFDLIHDVDLFVFYDDVQFTKNDWRNRNIIKTPTGPQWFSIPVGKRQDRLICEVELADREWARRHWDLLRQHYGKAPGFAHYAPFFEQVYLERGWRMLSELNQYLVTSIARDHLGITTEFRDSREFSPQGTKMARLVDLLTKVGAEVYVSGPSAKGYLSEETLAAAGIQVVWKSYEGYPEYPQLHPPFVHQVSIVDLLFNVGPAASRYVWGWRAAEPQACGVPVG